MARGSTGCHARSVAPPGEEDVVNAADQAFVEFALDLFLCLEDRLEATVRGLGRDGVR